jgi:hypothetical protein
MAVHWRRRLLVVALLALSALLVSACAGAGTAMLMKGPRLTARSGRSARSPATGSPRESRSGSQEQRPVLAGSATLARRKPLGLSSGQQRLLAASAACAVARKDAPPAVRRTIRPRALAAYARRAKPFAVATAKALSRTSARTLPAVDRLIADYTALVPLYGRAERGGAGQARSLVKRIASGEEEVGADALAARLPACAPTSPKAT